MTVHEPWQRAAAPRQRRDRRLGAARWPVAGGLVAGTLLDAIFTDPPRGHPVAAFGRAATALEARTYAATRTRGAVHAAACLLGAAAPAAAADYLTRGRPVLRLAVTAAVGWAVTGAGSLAHEAERLALALESGDVAAAQARLPALCGRDPARLGPVGLARAAVESVAENTCDAVVAPLLWGAAMGVTGLAGYRVVNTLDAMVGHRCPRYLDFGWAAARLDDVANAVPARLTSLLAAACAPAVGGRPGAALRTARAFGARHPSPNAGRCEAAFAGALGVRLGGTNVYGGVIEDRPQLGNGRPAAPADIRRAVRLSRAVTWAAVAVSAILAAASDWRRPARGREEQG